MLAPRAVLKLWRLTMPDGSSAPLRTPVVLGRRPDVSMGPDGARAVTLADPGKTLSRTHVILEPLGDAVRVTDISSVNGVVLRDEQGVETDLVGASTEVTGATMLQLGTVEVRLDAPS